MLVSLFVTSVPFVEVTADTGGETATEHTEGESSTGKKIGAAVSWIFETLLQLFDALTSTCVPLPRFNNFSTGSKNFSLNHTRGDVGKWVAVAHNVKGDKMVKLQWNTRGIQTRPRKYLVVYRIDPRFSRPQLFILKHTLGEYASDFHSYNGGELLDYQNNDSYDFESRGQKFEDYFNFRNGRQKIRVDEGDVISIALTNMRAVRAESPSFESFFSPSEGSFASLHLRHSLLENQVLLTGADNFCKYVETNAGLFPSSSCATDPATGRTVYAGNITSFRKLYGALDTGARLSLPPCADGISGLSPDPLCVYDKGRGMSISIGESEIKPTYTPFFESEISAKSFFYHKVRDRGELDFNLRFPSDSYFADFPNLMKDWPGSGSLMGGHGGMASYLTSLEGYTATMMNNVHMGRYIMLLNIGNSDSPANYFQQDDLKVHYKFTPADFEGVPDRLSAGTQMDSQEVKVNAAYDGTLWVQVENPNPEVVGNIRVSYAYYTGSTFLSDIMYDSIALPVMDMMRSTASLFYQGIAVNPRWQLMVRTLLTLYIIFYALYFLAGKVQITATDLVTRVIKVAVVFAMFDSNSWEFFNERVFTIFLDGMSYLAHAVTGVTSSVGNIFGFVDVIFDKYTNPDLWLVLLVQLLQLHNGMTFVSILFIEAILTYLMAVIDVVVSYLMAFVTMTVLISLAPIFIVCMLFERTRGMFDSWMSLLFNYMIQPTVLLIFFLLLDQMMSNQFSQTAMNVCWGMLVDLLIDIDLGFMRIKFDLPFIPFIPFFTPALAVMSITCPFVSLGGEMMQVVAAVLMFKIYSQLASGLVEYTTNLVADITNVAPGRKDGAKQSATNPTSAVANQIKAPAKFVGRGLSKGVKQIAKAGYEGWKNPKEKQFKEGGVDSKDSNPSMDQNHKDQEGNTKMRKKDGGNTET